SEHTRAAARRRLVRRGRRRSLEVLRRVHGSRGCERRRTRHDRPPRGTRPEHPMIARRLSGLALVLPALLGACAASAPPPDPRPEASDAPASPSPLPEERRFGSLRQLTFGGENAEAYWSFDGRSLILQAKIGDAGCDRIYHLPLDRARPELVPVSSGKGATTCAYFLPGDREIVYASTHLGGDACPPPPDRS